MDQSHLTYLDFELEIGEGEGRDYPVAVIRSPAGEAHVTMRFPYDELVLENRLLTLQNALLRSGGKRRLALSSEEQVVQDFGQDLFEALFTGEVRSRYDVSLERAWQAGKGLRLKLCIQSPELAALPWEYLYDQRQAEYVCLSRNTPVVRYLELPQPIPPMSVEPPLRILGLVASPSGVEALDVAREMGRVERALDKLRARGQVELVWLEGQTWRDLLRAMQGGPWYVFHFIGHGGFDMYRDEGFIILADEEGERSDLSATQLGRLLADHRWLRLALLNACEGGRGSERDIFSGTASILVRRGIPAVLAMQDAVTDRAAIEVSRAFYEALAGGIPVDAAVAEARKAVSLAVTNTVEWGTPVLYMRSPDGLLFSIREGEAREAVEKAAERTAREEVPLPELAPPREPEQKRKKPALVRTPLPHEPELILIPAGEFLMGSDDLKDKDAEEDEQPQHTVHLAEYYIAQTPLTNAQYAAFVEANGHAEPKHWEGGKPPKGKGEHPVVNVTWHDAVAYCNWLAETTGKPYRLPSEAEWEKAARGGLFVDGDVIAQTPNSNPTRIRPWGNEWDAKRCNSEEGGPGGTTPVGQYSPDGDSPYGCVDMAGNVFEWCATRWGKSYPYDVSEDEWSAAYLAGDDSRVLRGGSWGYDHYFARCASRSSAGRSYLGFRLVSPI
jgi:formylglycine-generating enzyme required for sulfatase activity